MHFQWHRVRNINRKNSILNNYSKGQAIFLQGNQPFGMFCVHSGKIKILNVNNDGKESIVRLATGGDILGHRALFSNEAYNASAITLEDSIITFFSKEFIFNVIKEHPAIALNIISLLSHTMGTAEIYSTTLVHKNVRERLAGLLFSLIRSYGIKEADRIRLDIRLTREEMAAMIGTTHETLVRLFTEFRNEEIIEQEGKIIFIINEKKLIEFAHV